VCSQVLNDKQLGSLPAPLAAKVLAAVQARRSEVEAKLKSSATSFTLTTLEEFDWSLRVTYYYFYHYCYSSSSSSSSFFFFFFFLLSLLLLL
jgi:hypothetical protein